MRIPGYGVCLYSNLLRPRSRGTVRLRSKAVDETPLIDPNYLADPYDRRMAIEGVKLAREVMAAPAFKPFLDKERMPGPAIRTDEELAAYVRQWAKTDYHPVGTCKMGTDEHSVVSPDLKVRGLERLRVCDSSIMPNEISANTNAPTIMIAEKAADMILTDAA
jgi:choline dehydrogenase-like flavoprotein